MSETRKPEAGKKPAINPGDLNLFIQKVLDEHQAEEVVVIDLAGKSTIGDYMVVATGRSSRQVNALAEALIQALKTKGLVGIRPEGGGKGDWILIDAGDVIVHLFRPEVRAFYSLEKMWEAEFTDSDETPDAAD